MKFPILLILIIIVFTAPKAHGQAIAMDWTAPESSGELKNPFAGEPDAINKGKSQYSTLCAICHGVKGKGDGIAGMSLNPRPSNLTSPKVQNQTDGALFWKLTEGNPPMASYRDLLTEEERWQLVNYIREFKK